MGNKKYHFEELPSLHWILLIDLLLPFLNSNQLESKLCAKNKFIHDFSLFYMNLPFVIKASL